MDKPLAERLNDLTNQYPDNPDQLAVEVNRLMAETNPKPAKEAPKPVVYFNFDPSVDWDDSFYRPDDIPSWVDRENIEPLYNIDPEKIARAFPGKDNGAVPGAREIELLTICQAVQRDLKLRAEPDFDGDGTMVVNLSAGFWEELNRVIGLYPDLAGKSFDAMILRQKVAAVEAFNEELKQASKSFLWPHFDGVCAVHTRRLNKQADEADEATREEHVSTDRTEDPDQPYEFNGCQVAKIDEHGRAICEGNPDLKVGDWLFPKESVESKAPETWSPAWPPEKDAISLSMMCELLNGMMDGTEGKKYGLLEPWKSTYERLAATLANKDEWFECSGPLPKIGSPVALINMERFENFPLEDVTGKHRHIQAVGYLDETGGQKYWSISGTGGGQKIDAYTHYRLLNPPHDDNEE